VLKLYDVSPMNVFPKFSLDWQHFVTIIKTINDCTWDPMKIEVCAICTSIFKFFVNISLMMPSKAETRSQ